MIENANVSRSELENLLPPFGLIENLNFFTANKHRYCHATMKEKEAVDNILLFGRHLFNSSGDLMYVSKFTYEKRDHMPTVMASGFPEAITEKQLEPFMRKLGAEKWRLYPLSSQHTKKRALLYFNELAAAEKVSNLSLSFGKIAIQTKSAVKSPFCYTCRRVTTNCDCQPELSACKKMDVVAPNLENEIAKINAQLTVLMEKTKSQEEMVVIRSEKRTRAAPVNYKVASMQAQGIGPKRSSKRQETP